MPVVILTGMRQVGKSTLLQCYPGLQTRKFFTLDDYPYLQTAKTNPDALLEADAEVTIDEAQRCPELLIAIKRKIDQGRKAGRFLLSGSANFALLKNVSESLAGRAIYLRMAPFSRREILRRTETVPFLLHILNSDRAFDPTAISATEPFRMSEVLAGGMPEVCLNQDMDRKLWFRGFEQTYLERDIRDFAQVGDRMRFRSLLQLAAMRTAQLLNISELGRDAGLNAATATRYLSIMEASFVVHKLEPYLKNPASRIIKSPKLYIADSGIACSLTSVEELSPARNEPLQGPLLETYAAHNLMAILDAHLPDARLYFWNVQGRYEVDFVIESGRQLIAIELKSASRWDERDLAGLKAFIEHHPTCKYGILAYNGDKLVEISPSIWAVPIGMLLS